MAGDRRVTDSNYIFSRLSILANKREQRLTFPIYLNKFSLKYAGEESAGVKYPADRWL